MKKIIVTLIAAFFIGFNGNAQFVQQGNKLVGTGCVGNYCSQGISVSISADGNTAIVGGFWDSSRVGAVWIYTHSGGVWTQQGTKLVGTGAVGEAWQGGSVSISADGNTALVGGSGDNNNAGAAWVFTRSGGVWTQQGSKLVGAGAIGRAGQGASVSLSADGNTALIGGPDDDSHGNSTAIGAAWVFTRSGGIWTQQGSKLIGAGATGYADQGESVSLSADGNTAMIGGYQDNNFVGAAWVFTRSGGVWNQQGTKLVGSGSIGISSQGLSVSLSADGNTALVGGGGDNIDYVGAAWIFMRSGGVWTQQGTKLVGTGFVGSSRQGSSVSLSADGNTAIVGGWSDNGWIGAAWVYTHSGGLWTQQGTKLLGTGGTYAHQGVSVSLSGDGKTAIVGGDGDNNNIGAVWVFVASRKCNFPPGTNVTNITRTKVRLNWDTIPGAERYRIHYRPLGTSTWTTIIVGSNIGFKPITGLTRNTTYEWNINTVCSISPFEQSKSSSTQTFTTHLRLEDDEISESESSFAIYPNPCTTCEIRGVDDANDIIVTDILGRKLNASFTKTSEGFIINLPDNSAGIYFVKNIKTGEAEKFVKE